MSKLLFLVSVLTMVLTFAGLGIAQTSTMHWTAGPSLFGARSSSAAVLNTDGIYVFGGNTATQTSVEKLLNGTNFWQPAPSLQVGISSPAVFGLTIYGGKDFRRAVNSVFTYNPLGGSSNLPSMKTRRYQHAYAALYAIGGKDDIETPLATAERFIGGKWLPTTSLPEARFNFPAAIDSSGRIMTFGGGTTASAFTSTVYRLDFSATWTAVAPMPIATSGSCAVAGANNLIYVIGGTSAGGPVNAVQIYHVLTDTWTLGSSLPTAVTNASSVIDPSGKIMVIGGQDAANQNVATVATSDQESAPPVINSFPVGGATIGVNYQYQVTSTGNPAANYVLLVSPSGMTIDGTTGIISWTPTISQVGVQSVTVRAANASGNNDQSFQINVPPPAPTGFAASSITANTADLTWDPAPAELGAVSYNLYVRGTVCGRGGCPIIPIVTGITSTTVHAVGLLSGASLTYYLRTNVGDTFSPLSFVTFVTLGVGAPTNVTASNVTQTSVDISWTPPATTGVPIVGYRVFESTITGLTVRADNITGTTATITGLLPHTTHTFYVVAFDANNNQSIFVASPVVNTRFPPTIFHNSVFPNGLGGFFPESVVGVIGDRLMLIAPDTRPSSGVNYVVGSTGLPAAALSIVAGPSDMTVDSATGIVSWVPSGPVGSFTATVRATNSEGFADLPFSYTVYPAGTDLLSPTPVNSGFTAANITRTTATVSWTASTDNVGVAGYRVYTTSPIIVCGRNGCAPLPVTAPVAVTTGTGTSATISGLTRNTGYSFWVEAFDAAGNTSITNAIAHGNFNTLP